MIFAPIRRKMPLALAAVLVAMTIFAAVSLACQAVRPKAWHEAGMTIDRLSATLTLLVGFVGTVTFLFSIRYLDGQPRQPRFLRWLFATVCSAFILMLATDLLLFFAAWSATSIGLHKLLTHYADRAEAWPPARKKFLISRLGDVALLSAIIVIYGCWGTTDLNVFLDKLGAGEHSLAAQYVAVLVAVAALTKSAQFPFHSWLPETMESPTPVSALMHAGIINAGGALLLRFAPLIAGSDAARILLTLIGTVTAAIGLLAMWAQVKVKRTLAWSTVSQMGFMMVQCGLTVFPAAVLHIVGHGCYKAWSFLRSGSLPEPMARGSSMSSSRALVLATVGTAVAIFFESQMANITGFRPTHSPGELALSGILAMSVGQLWVAFFRNGAANYAALSGRFILAVATSALAVMGAFTLYRLAELFFKPVLGDLGAPWGPLYWTLASVPIVTLISLVVFHASLPRISRSAFGRAMYVHALHGFYFGAIADRVVARTWRMLTGKEVTHA